MKSTKPASEKKSNPSWPHKDLVGIRDLSAKEISLLLDTAKIFKDIINRPIKKVPSLRGKTVINLFVETSTRTRTSFELAAKRLSADVVTIDTKTSSLTKGETLKDTAINLQALNADVIVFRHHSAGAPHFLSKHLYASVINAGDGAHEHPTQALLDAFTIREHLGDLKGVNVAIVGDVLHSRVARSNVLLLTKMGAKVTLVGPSTLLPDAFKQEGVSLSYDLESVLPKMDVVELLRIQLERQDKVLFPSIDEYISFFGLTQERMKCCKKKVLIMHPGPINRGVEMASEIADGPHSVITEQVMNGLAVRMAVLYLCANRGNLEGITI